MLVKIGKTETKIHDKSLENAVNEFAYLKQKIDSLNDELKAFKEIIINKASEQLLGSDSLSVSFESMNENKVKVSFGWDVKVSNPDTLAVLLGDKFDLLVKSEMTYKAEKKAKRTSVK
ncbi:hypothetical protein [Campylobacter fetus]|uniref:hypothetical protein n=1 Tax=Campylobacter fetus TaxID=196 RepID=UPI000818C902|nr:hypothetical protein [Campylobacter fetus]OCS25331.1 hypothetical protein CFVB10_09015 [Campylobacter fetus subsp. venerealis cfvB10]